MRQMIHDRCSQQIDAANKCESGKGLSHRLGELERVVEGHGEFRVARHREVTR